MKKLLPLLLLFFSVTILKAQQSPKINIKGIVVDTAKAVMPFTPVFLLQPADSSLVTFARSNENGEFEFKGVKRQNYLLKITYMSYLPHQELIKPNESNVIDAGTIQLKLLQKELYEVVVKTAKAPISIKGDTVEYDARKFKVPPGSSVEDLLRKLPGFQLDSEGNIKAQGETVNKVFVDGKRFFGDDPKLATKNLPAESINKVQVFNDKSEQSKLTGVEDGKREKAVNLELKEEFKKGGFGKLTAGVGTDQRVMGKGNYNKFDSKNQFSVIGFGNNINQTGLSGNDYEDFKGSQSYNWNNNADFGFSGGMVRFSYGSDEESEGIGVPQSWGPGSGLSKNYAGGVNYNYDTKKTKFSSNYFYNQSTQNLSVFQNSQNFIPDNSFFLRDSSQSGNFTANHRLSLRFEKEIDSLNTLVLNFNGRLGDRSTDYNSMKNYLTPGESVFRTMKALNVNDATTGVIASSAIYRHKFMKKGRSFAASASYNLNNIDKDARQNSVIRDYPVAGWDYNIGGRNFDIFQNDLGLVNSNQIKSSLLFIEPLSKKFNIEGFYNFSNTRSLVDRDVYNLFSDGKPRIDSLSRYYENTINYNRLGTALRYNYKGLNIALGAAGQQFNLKGKFYNDQNKPLLGSVDRKYFALVPNSSINYALKNNRFLFVNYDVGVQEPRMKDMQPFQDNSNPLYITSGNPDLLPQTTHNAFAGFSMFNPVSFINIFANVNYTYSVNQIIYNQTIDQNLVTYIKPENISGGKRYGYYFQFGFPIKKTKISANVSSNSYFAQNLIYINSKLNENNTENYNVNFRLDLTPVDWFSLFINASHGIGKAQYSINTTQNQRFINQNLSANMVIQLPKLIFFTSDFNYMGYKNERFGFDQKIPILNMAVYKVLGKAKKSEVRVTLYDAFKKNQGISQGASSNLVSQTQTVTLSRYLMFTYTYNMRGISTKVKKNRWE